MRGIAIALSAAAMTVAALGAEKTVMAEPEDAASLIESLRQRPASIWDLGLMRLSRDAARAATRVGEVAGGFAIYDIVYSEAGPSLSVEFDVRNPVARTEGACVRYRQQALQEMTGALSAATAKDQVHRYLARAFSPSAAVRDEDTTKADAALLAEMTEVTLQLGIPAEITCSGPITQWRAREITQ